MQWASNNSRDSNNRAYSRRMRVWHSSLQNNYTQFYPSDVYQPADIESLGEQDKINSSPTVSCHIKQASTMLFMNLEKLINTGLNARKGSNPGEAHSLGLRLCICHLANEDTIFRMLRVVHFIHIGWRYCKRGPVITEGKWRDAGGVPMELAQPLFVKWVPDIYKSIRTTYK